MISSATLSAPPPSCNNVTLTRMNHGQNAHCDRVRRDSRVCPQPNVIYSSGGDTCRHTGVVEGCPTLTSVRMKYDGSVCVQHSPVSDTVRYIGTDMCTYTCTYSSEVQRVIKVIPRLFQVYHYCHRVITNQARLMRCICI